MALTVITAEVVGDFILCQSVSRRQFTTLMAAAISMPYHANAQDVSAIRTLHGQLDIDSFKGKTSARVKSGAKRSVFVVGGDAFLTDEAFEAEIAFSEAGLVDKIAVLSGQALGVFKPLSARTTKVILPNSTGSIRGTGCYVNVSETRPLDYICCCYGHITFPNSTSGARQSLQNSYHNAVTIDEDGNFGTPDYTVPFGHYDDELVMLEKQVNRTPDWVLPDDKMHFLSPNALPL